jgi:hypothetical protein
MAAIGAKRRGEAKSILPNFMAERRAIKSFIFFCKVVENIIWSSLIKKT